MKAEIITRHAIANYGSLLQSYATGKIFQNLGIEYEIIDYVREEEQDKNLVKTYTKNSRIWNFNFFTRTAYKLIQTHNISKMNNKFREYRKKYLKLSERTYKNYQELVDKLPNAEIFCTGSDQVWGQIANDDYDENYFLKFVPKGKKCIAYSASFGKKEISEKLKKNLPELMKKYNSALVREDSAIEILNNIGYNKAKLVLDPTLILSRKDWEEFVIENPEKEKYILVYQLHHNKNFDKYLKKLSKKTNLNVIRISPSIYFKFKQGKFKYLPTLEEFITYFKNAEYIVTDSFHGTVFSIIFNIPMIDILPKNTGTRIESILELFDIKERIVKDYNDFSILDKKINFDRVNIKLSEERNKSLEYLKNALEE